MYFNKKCVDYTCIKSDSFLQQKKKESNKTKTVEVHAKRQARNPHQFGEGCG